MATSTLASLSNDLADLTTAGAQSVVQVGAGRRPASGVVHGMLDLMMPRVDGYGVLQHLQANHPDKLRCTIIASAVPESEILKRFDMPVFRIHAKPFDMAKLIADIHECVDE